MRIVIALGGNALLRRGDPITTEVQRHNIEIAAEAIAPLAAGHSIVIAHGNGPQVGLLWSMGPKVEAAVRFTAKTGKRAAIGSLADIAGIVAGTVGTNVVSGQEPHPAS